MRNRFKNYKIGKKLTVIFAMIIACFAVFIMVSLIGLTRVGDNMKYFYSTPYRNNMAQLQLRRDVQSAMKNILWLCTTEDKKMAEQLNKDIQSDLASQNTQLEFLKENSAATDLLAQLETAMADNKEARTKVVDFANAGDSTNALKAFNEEYSVKANIVLELLNHSPINLPLMRRRPKLQKTMPRQWVQKLI